MAAISEAVFQILLSLTDQHRHGLGIAAEVKNRTGRRVQLGAGTLYTALRRMTEDGWLVVVPAPEADTDPRRRYYALTAEGRQVLLAEAHRLQSLVKDARHKKVLPRRRSR